MFLEKRQIAVCTAVICFFGTSIIGWLSGLTPLTCCKRALIAAIIVLILTSITVKAINSVITSAMISSHINKHRKKPNAGGS